MHNMIMFIYLFTLSLSPLPTALATTNTQLFLHKVPILLVIVQTEDGHRPCLSLEDPSVKHQGLDSTSKPPSFIESGAYRFGVRAIRVRGRDRCYHQNDFCPSDNIHMQQQGRCGCWAPSGQWDPQRPHAGDLKEAQIPMKGTCLAGSALSWTPQVLWLLLIHLDILFSGPGKCLHFD